MDYKLFPLFLEINNLYQKTVSGKMSYGQMMIINVQKQEVSFMRHPMLLISILMILLLINFAIFFVEFLGAGEQGHHVDDVVRGVRVERHALLRDDRIDRFAKIIAEIVHRHDPAKT